MAGALPLAYSAAPAGLHLHLCHPLSLPSFPSLLLSSNTDQNHLSAGKGLFDFQVTVHPCGKSGQRLEAENM